MTNTTTDILIIGGGASGLAAAVSAAKTSASSVTVCERLPRVGKKILSTGNGRCNLSNKNVTADSYSGARSLFSYTECYPSSEIFFSELGLACRCDPSQRIYPHSMAASSVLDALRFAAQALNVNFVCDCRINSLYMKENCFRAIHDNGEITAKRIILAAGGCASPSLGTDGSGYRLAKQLGHTITRITPALAPLRTDVSLVKAIKGLRTPALARLIADGREILCEEGEIQFSDGALSGICIFNLSEKAAKYVGRCEISIDAAPDYTVGELYAMLNAVRNSRYNIPCEELLTGLFHKRIGQQILKVTLDIPFSTECGMLSDKQLSALCRTIKDWRFPVTGVSDWSLAQITAGGINGSEINKNLESKITSGLYLCGEIIDIQGPCGGYNLEWAWRSGYTAGVNCAASL